MGPFPLQRGGLSFFVLTVATLAGVKVRIAVGTGSVVHNRPSFLCLISDCELQPSLQHEVQGNDHPTFRAAAPLSPRQRKYAKDLLICTSTFFIAKVFTLAEDLVGS